MIQHCTSRLENPGNPKIRLILIQDKKRDLKSANCEGMTLIRCSSWLENPGNPKIRLILIQTKRGI